MKGLMLIANLFEDVEAITTLDVLRRGGITIYTASTNSSKKVLTQNGLKIETDLLLSQINYKDYDFLVIPGGKAVTQSLLRMPIVNEIVKHFNEEKKLSCFICAAPIIPGKLGLLRNKHYVCYGGYEKEVVGGLYEEKKDVCKDGLVITGRSMYYSTEFALCIIEELIGKNQRDIIEASLKGKKDK